MFGLLEALIEALEGALTRITSTVEEGTTQEKWLARTRKASDLRLKFASTRQKFNPFQTITKTVTKFRSRGSMSANILSMRKADKFLKTLDASQKIDFEKTLGNLTKAQRVRALMIIKTYKVKNRSTANIEVLTRNTNDMLNEIFNEDKENNVFKIGNDVEFSALTSSWLVYGIWRTTSTEQGGSIIGNITLTTKQGYTFTVNNVPKEVWFLMKNATGKYGHWFAPKGAGSWYWNWKMNGQISTAGMELDKVKKYIKNTVTAKGLTTIIFNRRSKL